MKFLNKLFKGSIEKISEVKEESTVCPRLENLSGYYGYEYWCDLGTQRIKIKDLIYSYKDIGHDHVEQICKGRYKGCQIYRGFRK